MIFCSNGSSRKVTENWWAQSLTPTSPTSTSFFFLTLADLPCCVSGKWVPKNQKVTKDPPYPGEA